MELFDCGEDLCTLCGDRRDMDKRVVGARALQGIEDVPEPCVGEAHVIYTRAQTERVSHFTWNDSLRPILANGALDQVCSVYPEPKSRMQGWEVHQYHWGNGHQLSTCRGRQVRDVSTIQGRNLGRPFYRVVESNSVLAMKMVNQVHDHSHHRGVEAGKHLLETTGVKIPNLRVTLKGIISQCRVCHLDRVQRANPSRLLKRTKWGPMDIGTISEINQSSASSYWVCDTVGPLHITCPSEKCHNKGNIVIFVQLYVKRVVMQYLPDLSIKTMYDALVKLTSTEGRIELLVCDPASQFKGIATDVSELDMIDNEEAINAINTIAEMRGE